MPGVLGANSTIERVMRSPILVFTIALFAPVLRAADLDRPPINYSTAKTQNAVDVLKESVRTEKAQLVYEPEHGYLKSLLKELNVPVSSQTLVFSRTSLQRSRIGPKTPRAIYFNDDVTIGYCRKGDVLEVAASDPTLGTVFYTLDQNPAKNGAFTRQTENCLICHGSSRNQGFPGHLVRSVSPSRSGDPVLTMGTKHVDHGTPFEDRWGGWFVTGTSGKQTHMGNQMVGGWPGLPEETSGTNVTDLRPYFTVANYPSPHSDLVALMVLEHQGELQNRIARANFQTRLALNEQAELNKLSGDPVNTRSDSITKRIHWACEPVVQFLLFCEEAKLTEPVAGTSEFAKEFATRGPFDSQKRSLREFDLKTRLFRYPLSYIIYTKLFDGLPSEAKERVYLRLWEVLTGKDETKEFAHLPKADRQAIREILIDTKKGLPEYWQK
jgi:hypothetical protein